MSKRRVLWTAFLLVAVLVALPFLPLRIYVLLGMLRREPFFRGLPASYWHGAVRSWCQSERGTKPVPYGARLMRKYFGWGVRPAVLWCREREAVPVLLVLLRTEDADVREEVAQTLSGAEPDAPLLRAFLALLDDSSPGCSETASWLLSRYPPWEKPLFLGEPRSVPGEEPSRPDFSRFIEALTDPDPRIRVWAAYCMGELVWFAHQPGPNGGQAVTALVAALRDENEQVREAAAVTLKYIDRDAARKAGVE
jgi:hypothetical protein